MSKKRLYKSSDAVISGVCGGLAEYFGIDSTLLRILAVALTLCGMGLPAVLYVICMIVLPPDPGTAQGYVDAYAEKTESPCSRIYASVSTDTADNAGAATQPPPTSGTRVSAGAAATTGSIPKVSEVADAAKNHSTTVLTVGAVLVAVGIIALLCNFVHISVWRFWPIVLVVLGLVCLFTPGAQGWSLVRAGNAIVLITIGLALLAWMLQIIQTRVFIAAFFELWPALLIAAGLSIIGSARKSSAISLFSSLVLSATIVFGLWVYSGLDLMAFSQTTLLMETDGFHELLEDIHMWD